MLAWMVDFYLIVNFNASFTGCHSLGTLLALTSLFFGLCAAIVSGGKGTAQDKIKTLREAGVTVVESPAKIGVAMLDVFKQRGLAD